MSVEGKKLWECEHPYYCTLDNYFASGDKAHASYKSWQDFMDEEEESDLDMNLVFRWDWKLPDDVVPEDANYRSSTMEIFILGQRKGIFRTVKVDICLADEPHIRNWLLPRWKKMQALWAPFSGVEEKE
jgi:hypothetical protein